MGIATSEPACSPSPSQGAAGCTSTDYACNAEFQCNSPPCACPAACTYTAPVTYIPQYTTCDPTTIFALKGTLVDGSSPVLGADTDYYMGDLNCARTIRVPRHLRLALRIESLSLGGAGSEGDMLEIYDGLYSKR